MNQTTKTPEKTTLVTKGTFQIGAIGDGPLIQIVRGPFRQNEAQETDFICIGCPKDENHVRWPNPGSSKWFIAEDLEEPNSANADKNKLLLPKDHCFVGEIRYYQNSIPPTSEDSLVKSFCHLQPFKEGKGEAATDSQAGEPNKPKATLTSYEVITLRWRCKDGIEEFFMCFVFWVLSNMTRSFMHATVPQPWPKIAQSQPKIAEPESE